MGITIDESEYADTNLDTDETARRRGLVRTVRPVAFYLSLLVAGVMTVLFLPELLVTLVTGWTAEMGAELGIHRLHIMGIAAVIGVFLLGLFAQAYQPRKRVASIWGAFVVILVVSVGTVWFGVGRPEEVLPFMLFTSIALASHPAGRGLLRRGDTFSPALLGLVALAAVPLLVFVASQIVLTTSTSDPHALAGHYVMMTGLALAPLAFGVFAALGFTGWRLAAWLAALPMAYYGLLSIAFPMQSGSTGLLWGAMAIVWAIAFVAAAEYSRRTSSEVFYRDARRTRA